MTDPVDDFLERPFACDGNGALQDALRARTTRVLSRKRRVRYLAWIGTAAACYLTGVATMWVSQSRPTLPDQPPQIAKNQQDAPAPKADLPERPEVIEMQALAQPANRAAQLRKAGDLYVALNNDYASAVRCYAEALRAGGADALQVSPDDNGLLMAMAAVQRTENLQASSDDGWLALAIEYKQRKEKSNER